ncbi:sensor domain-containing protein, partial [Catenulispora sp. NL8]
TLFTPKAARSRRGVLIIGLVVVVVLGGSGLTWALWPSKSKAPVVSSPEHVVPGTLQASILTPDDVSKAVGTTVIAGSAVNQPPAALTADPASCAMAVGPATVSGYTKGWTVFYSTTYQDSGGTGDYTVTQTIGDYGDPGQAGAVFQALGQGVAACPSATRTDQNKNTVKWNYSVEANTPNQLAWTAAQDAGGGWACYRQARLKGAAVLQVAICEGGDGKTAAAKVADAFEAKVSG